ncbi:hypothetical protein [Streptomyces sp. bgisy022]
MIKEAPGEQLSTSGRSMSGCTTVSSLTVTYWQQSREDALTY